MGTENLRLGLIHVVILCVLGNLADPDLEGKVFIFPRKSTTSYVLLTPTLGRLLQEFTLCLDFFTDLTRSFSLFSAASKDHHNEILLIRHPMEYNICIGNHCLDYPITALPGRSLIRWETACVAWDSATGIVQLWLDGQALPRKGAVQGYRVKQDLVMILGQEQDSYGGSFDAEQSFVGELANVYLWDTVLPPDQLRSVQRQATPTPLVDWTSLKFEIKGDVVTEDIR